MLSFSFFNNDMVCTQKLDVTPHMGMWEGV